MAALTIDWDNDDFWKSASTEDVTQCLEQGADIGHKYTGGRSPLHMAAMACNSGAIDVLVAAKADIEAKDNSGATPLHVAAVHGDQDTVLALIEGKANLDARDNDEKTPLDKACEQENWETAQVLKWLHNHPYLHYGR